MLDFCTQTPAKYCTSNHFSWLHSSQEMLWYLYNTSLIALRILTTPGTPDLSKLFSGQLTSTKFILNTLAAIFLLFWLISMGLKKKSTKKRILLVLYFAIIVLIITLFLCGITLDRVAGHDLLAATTFNSFYLVYMKASILLIFGVWSLIIYSTGFLYPLDGFYRPFSSWWVHLVPLLIFVLLSVNSKASMIVLCEALSFFFYTKLASKSLSNCRWVEFGPTLSVIFFIVFYSLRTCSEDCAGFSAYACDFFAVLWVVFHTLKMDWLVGTKHPAVFFFFKLAVFPTILIIFLRIYSGNVHWALVCPCTLWTSLLIFRKLLAISGYLPLKAFPRIHKIAMFEDAPEAEIPTQSIEFINFNSNILKVISVTSDVIFITILQQTLFGAGYWFGLSCVSISAYSLWGTLSVYTSILILHNFKTKSILDFRGLFLAIHQYQWCSKYAYILYLHVCFLLLTKHVVILLQALTDQTLHRLVLVVFFVSIPPLVFMLWRFAYVWGELLPYWQDYYYTNWCDEYWSHTAPFMRDYIYWKPIEPDDAEEVRPFYFYLQKKATTRYLLVFFCLYMMLCLLVSSNLLIYASIPLKYFTSKLLFWVIIIKAGDDVVDTDVFGPQSHIYDFAYFESIMGFVYGFFFLSTIYYYYYFSWDEWDTGLLSYILD